MLKTHLKTAFRNLKRNSKSSFINIAGLALGMMVFILIALWIWDELSFDKYHKNYDRIGQIVQIETWNGERHNNVAVPFLMGDELSVSYGENFRYMVMASFENSHILSGGEKHLSRNGIFMGADAPEMLSLDIISGSRGGLKNPNSIMLSVSAAKALFGDSDPLNQMMRIDKNLEVKVTAVYEDLPHNSTFRNLEFIAPWDLYINSEAWIKNTAADWGNNSFQLFAQIREGLNFETVNKNIILAKRNRATGPEKSLNAEIVLHPMRDWHLRNEWKNGRVAGGLIEYVRLFSIVGIFVLLLACINFMNLSTARSEKRAKEVGVRKTIGSSKNQLVAQFLSESILVAFIAFLLAIVMVQLSLPWFNQIADKQMSIPWLDAWFWIYGLSFTLLTGIIAGSYPAFYLSSFHPLKVLKGTFRMGRMASLPREVLVVVQFAVSVALVIGTIIVFQQIQYTKNRPVGYNRDRLLMIDMVTADFYGKFDVLRTSLKAKEAIEELSESSSPVTEIYSDNDGFEWEGKDPALHPNFSTIWVTHEYGKTIDWKIREGRDFSRAFSTDSSSVIINEAAVKFMGIKEPVGKIIRWGSRTYRIVGVVNDIVMDSPFREIKQAVYILDYENVNWINLKLNPDKSTRECLALIQAVFKDVIPDAPFTYKFADQEYAAKFSQEERIGELATFFALFAIVISCLGVFGLASFIAEQRTKEIGIRKIVGASIFQLWKLLSRDFIVLVLVASLIAVPVSYYFLHEWLQSYEYRVEISGWIFILTTFGALIITMTIVSFQIMKAAVMSPVDSLRSE